MRRLLLFTFGAIIFFAGVSFAQPTFTIQNKKDACDGLANGSFEVLVSAASTPPLRVFVFGPPDQGPINATIGVPLLITGLEGGNGTPSFTKTYLVVVQDAGGSSVQFINITTITTGLSVTLQSKTDNSNCTVSNGAIDINVSGGSGNGYTYGWVGPNGFTASTEDISGLTGGSYTVTVLDNGTNCGRVLSSIVITDPTPVSQTITNSGPQIVCFGSDLVLELGGSEVGVNYEVILNNVIQTGIIQIGTGVPLSFVIPFASFSNGDNFKVRATSGVCQADMGPVLVANIVPLPVPTITSGPNDVCINSTGNVYTTQAGKTNYVWTVTGGTITAGGTGADNSATVTWTTAGAQNISINYTENGCTAVAPASYAVNVNALPVPTIISGPNDVCINSTGNVYTTQAGKTNYIWNVIGGTITAGGSVGDNTVTVTWTAGGAQSISINYTENGCTAVVPGSYAVNVNALPVPTIISGPNDVCANSVGNLYTTQAGKTNYVWAVTGGTITAGGTAADNTATVTWTTPGAQNISINYTENGCTAVAPASYAVNVNALPVPTIISGPNDVCINSTGNLYTTQAGRTNYIWNVTGGTITAGGTAADNTATVTWTTPGAQSISINYTANGCTAVAPGSYAVNVNALPVPTIISGPNDVCANSVGNLYTTQAGKTNYVWAVTGGTITAGGTAADNTATVTWTTPGAQNISINYTENGCTAVTPASYAVNVNPLPVPTITSGPNDVCINSTGNVYTTQAGKTNYIWAVTGGTITAGGTAADNTATVTWTTPGAQNISINYTENGCTAVTPASYAVNVNPLPIPTIISGPNDVCINSTGNVYTTQAGRTNYIWNVTGGTITAGGTVNDNTVTVTWTASGAQSVSINYTENGCTAVAPGSYAVNVNALPVPTIISGPNDVCANSTGNLYTTEAGKTNYIWSITGGTVTAGGMPTDNTVTITWTAVGPQSVSINYTENGCTAATSALYPVNVKSLPVPTIISGPNDTCVNSTGNVYTTEVGKTNYIWSVVGGTITAGGSTTDNTVTITWTTVGSQSISINYTENGCTAAMPAVYAVNVNAIPVPTIISGPNDVCANSIGNVYTTEAGKTNYFWSVVGGTITAGGTSTDNTVTVTWTAFGSQSVSINYTENGCTAATPTVYAVNVNAIPIPTIISGPNDVCANSTGNVYTTEVGKTNYIWNVVGGTVTAGGTPTDNTVTVTWTAVGAQSVSINYTENGCVAVAPTVYAVNVNTLPVPTIISGPNDVCVNSTGNVYTTEVGKTNYVWNVVGGTITAGGTAIDNTVTVTWTAVGPQSVSINYTENGCVAVAPVVYAVDVNALPIPTIISGPNDVCANSTGNVYTTEASKTNYVWNVVGGTITAGGTPTDNTVTVTWTAVGAQSVSINYTENGCSSLTPGSIVVNVGAQPTITTDPIAPICSGLTSASLPYTATTGAPDQYSIDFNAAAEAEGFVDVVNAPLAASPIVITVPAGANAANYTGTLTVRTSGSGCVSAPSAISITITPSPTATITGTTTICSGSSTSLTVALTGTTPWTFRYFDGTTTSAPIVSAFNTFSIPTGALSATTTYTIVDVSDASVCDGIVTGSGAVVTVSQPPAANLVVGVTLDPLCSGGVSDVTIAASQLGVSYQLRNDAGDVLIGAPVIGTGLTISIPTGVLLATTTFNILATATGCPPVELTSLATVNVTGAINAGLSVTAASSALCSGSSTNIQIAASENGVLYQLRNDADNSTIGLEVPGNGGLINLPTGNLTATTTFNVLATNGACSIELTDLETVTVSPAPSAALVVAVTLDPLCVGGSTTVTVELSEVGISYQLRNDADDSPVGPAVVGTGATISLPTGVLNATTTFNVLATGVGCPAVELTTLAPVTVSGSVDATLTLVAAASPICEGSGTDIQIANSEIGVDYQLRDNANDNPVGTPVAGTGATILLPTGNLSATTTFNVLATNGSCSIELTDLETVNVDVAPNPALAVNVSLNPLCIGGTSAVTVSLSQIGVSYQLRNDADDSTIGSAVVGTGGTISLPTGILNATTTFNILATSGICPATELTTTPTITVVGTLDASLAVNSSASTICAGSSTFIQVVASESGVNYQLRNDLDDAPVGSPVVGNGGTINLPTGNLSVNTTFNVVASNGTCSIELTDTETITISPSPLITLAVTASSALICSGASSNIVVTASEVGVSYQLRNNIGNVLVGSAVTGTGGNILLPTGNLTANTTFNVLATVGTCSVQLTATATVTIRPIGDPACGGGGPSDCTNFSSIQPTIVTQPSCNDRDAGEVSFNIARADGTPTTFRVLWTINGNTQTKFTSGTTNFDDLSSGLYQYTIIDEGNGRSCGPVDFFLDLRTQVEILDKQVIANVTCFGGTDGNVILSVDGSTTGEYWYRYVLNGVESGGQTFTPGAPLPGGLPADDNNFIILKVDQSFAFSCPDTVMVRIRHTFPIIDFTLAATEVTTCNGTDGAIRVSGIGGGDSGSGALQVRLKRAVPFSTDPSGYIVQVDFEDVVAGFKEYTSLAQGNYIVDVRDQLDCIRSKPIAVQAPGQVSLSSVSIVATDATCTNGGESGAIQVSISEAGLFQVAISRDQVNVPDDDEFVNYNSPSLPSITFNNLVRGVYYLYFKSNTTTCPTRTDAIMINGVQAVGRFDVLASCDNVNLTINNITGQQDAPFVIRVFSNANQFFKIDSLAASSIPISNAVAFVYNPPLQHSFLNMPGTYRFVMVQNQTTGAGTCTLVSDTVVYNVRQGLGIVVGQVQPSFPEPKRTGSIEIENIVGGTRFISTSNELFYEVSLSTADDDILIFDWTEVKLNPQNRFSKLYDFLPPGVYRISVRDFAGCVRTQDVEITLDPSIYIPNIFTPNDDNVNDQFEVLNLPLTGTHRLIISNRWGNEVFQSKDYREGNFWDAGETADGIYFYRLQVDGGETYTGWVEILRGSKP